MAPLPQYESGATGTCCAGLGEGPEERTLRGAVSHPVDTVTHASPWYPSSMCAKATGRAWWPQRVLENYWKTTSEQL